jgi:hypothetical protein
MKSRVLEAALAHRQGEMDEKGASRVWSSARVMGTQAGCGQAHV